MNQSGTTIYDIASEAGVSIATVSRVLKGEASVASDTRRRVEEVIARRNYRPSSIARGLISKTTHSLGIVLPKLLNPNYAMIFTGAQEEARRLGYTVSLFPWSSLDTKAYDPAAMLPERRLDGVIICVEYLPAALQEAFRQSLRELRAYMPVVLIGCVPGDLDYPTITYNMAEITRSTVDELVSLGHERIALIGGMAEDQDELRRDVGYREGLEAARLPYTWIPTGSSRRHRRGRGTAPWTDASSLLQPEYWPTAVIALNDLVAMGCQAALRGRGLRMPEQLSIVGCDDLFCAPYLCPALTSINTQQRTGARAVQLLISGENKRETVKWDWVHRASCGPAPKK